MNRRRFFVTMGGLAAGAVAAAASTTPGSADDLDDPPSLAVPTSAAPPLLAPPPSKSLRVAPGKVPLTALPGSGTSLALTIDDGVDADVVAAYIKFARDTGARFTFFVTASYQSWTTNRADLRPLVDSGQIQLGNHTWDHPDLTTLSKSAVAEQLRRTQKFLSTNYGVTGAPYYRPPYGKRNAAVDAVAADLGYSVPTMWYGSLSDSEIITTDYLLECARKYFTAQAIVIGHANHLPVTRVYDKLVGIIRERGLSMVTLDDVLLPPR